jgi:hypothetical protein
MNYPPLVLAACLRRGVMVGLLKSYQVTTDDVFLDFGEGNVVRVEISCLPVTPAQPQLPAGFGVSAQPNGSEPAGGSRGTRKVATKRPVNTRKR